MADLQDLEPLAKRLNTATNDLNSSLQSIQDRLNALAIGVEVWLDASLHESPYRQLLDDRDEPTGEREFTADELGYGRLGNGWALLVRERRYVDAGPDGYGGRTLSEFDDGNPETPLLRASKKLRLAAVPLIPKLVDAIKTEAEKQLAAIEEAKKIADSLK
jgi:hypothetical protein